VPETRKDFIDSRKEVIEPEVIEKNFILETKDKAKKTPETGKDFVDSRKEVTEPAVIEKNFILETKDKANKVPETRKDFVDSRKEVTKPAVIEKNFILETKDKKVPETRHDFVDSRKEEKSKKVIETAVPEKNFILETKDKIKNKAPESSKDSKDIHRGKERSKVSRSAVTDKKFINQERKDFSSLDTDEKVSRQRNRKVLDLTSPEEAEKAFILETKDKKAGIKVKSHVHNRRSSTFGNSQMSSGQRHHHDSEEPELNFRKESREGREPAIPVLSKDEAMVHEKKSQPSSAFGPDLSSSHFIMETKDKKRIAMNIKRRPVLPPKTEMDEGGGRGGENDKRHHFIAETVDSPGQKGEQLPPMLSKDEASDAKHLGTSLDSSDDSLGSLDNIPGFGDESTNDGGDSSLKALDNISALDAGKADDLVDTGNIAAKLPPDVEADVVDSSGLLPDTSADEATIPEDKRQLPSNIGPELSNSHFIMETKDQKHIATNVKHRPVLPPKTEMDEGGGVNDKRNHFIAETLDTPGLKEEQLPPILSKDEASDTSWNRQSKQQGTGLDSLENSLGSLENIPGFGDESINDSGRSSLKAIDHISELDAGKADNLADTGGIAAELPPDTAADVADSAGFVPDTGADAVAVPASPEPASKATSHLTNPVSGHSNVALPQFEEKFFIAMSADEVPAQLIGATLPSGNGGGLQSPEEGAGRLLSSEKEGRTAQEIQIISIQSG
jgi:hypothetical protein